MKLMKMKLDLENYKIVYSASQNISEAENDEEAPLFDSVEEEDEYRKKYKFDYCADMDDYYLPSALRIDDE